MRNLILALVLGLCVNAQAQMLTVSTDTSGNLKNPTNFFWQHLTNTDNTIGLVRGVNGKIDITGVKGGSQSSIFYDEFTGSPVGCVGFLQRRSTSGHFYADLVEGAPGMTNNLEMGGGTLHQTNADRYGAFYLCVTNSDAQKWNYFGAQIRYIPHGPNTTENGATMVKSAVAGANLLAGDYLHYFVPYVGGSIILQRALAENLIVQSFFPGTNVLLEAWTFTNGVVIRCNDYYGRYWGTNLTYATGRIFAWELNGWISNSVLEAQYDRIWAGYMSPQESSQLQVYLNNTNLAAVPANGLYTNDLNNVNSGTGDNYVGIPNGPAIGRTNVLPNARIHPGRLITIRDSGYTAAITNLSIIGQHGQTINGTLKTNIAVNGGSISLISDGANWQVITPTLATPINALSNLVDVVVSGPNFGDFLQVGPDGFWRNAGASFNNYNYYNVTVVSNVTIYAGTNIEQYVKIQTSNSFGIIYLGTPRPDERLYIAVFNTNNLNALDITMTNNSYNTLIGANTQTYTIKSNSIASFLFINRTNWNVNGTNRWELDSYTAKNDPLVLNAITYNVETRLIPTNSALSNIVVNFAVTNMVDVWFTNNITLTNWLGLASNSSANVTYMLRPQLVNRGVNWGNLGISNPGYRVGIYTNANNALWTTLTNGKVYSLSMSTIGTNIFPTLTLWE
jgi:hypothetical protein